MTADVLRIARVKVPACVILMLTGISAVHADHYSGRLLFRGDAMPLRIELAAGADAGTEAWLDLPGLLMAREPIVTAAADDGIRLTLPFGIGEFTVDPEKLPARIERKLGDEVMALELAPGPPPPYARRPVRFTSAGLALDGQLYWPAGEGPHLAVALLHGANLEGLDDWAYRSWADWYARRGVAVLAWNKRAGAGTEPERPADLRQLADDAVAAVQWLRAQAGDEVVRVGLHGGSQGGWTALQVAADLGDIDFLVLTSVAAVAPWRQQMQEVEWGMRGDGVAEDDIDAALAYLGLYFHVVHSGRGWEELAAAAQAAQSRSWGQYVDQPRNLADLAWWRANCCFQPGTVAASLDLPVLALYGGTDWIVPPIENADRLPDLFAQARRVEVRVLPGADHRLEMPMGTDAGGRWRWPRMAEELFPILDEWLIRNRLAPCCG